MSSGPHRPDRPTTAPSERNVSHGSSAVSALGRRSRRKRGRHGRPTRGAQAMSELFRGGPVLAAAGPVPSLRPPEPETSRGAWISGALSVWLHLSAVGFFAASAWLAPEIADEVIPVKILKDARPSDAEPAPVAVKPRTLAPRRAVQATATVAPRAIPRAPIAGPTAVSPVVPTETVRMAQIDPGRAPSQVVQQQVRSDVVRAVRSPTANSASPVAIAPTAPVAIQPSSVAVVDPSATGPVAIAPTQQVAVGAPQAFSSLGEANASDYAPSTDLPAQAIAGSQPTSEFGVTADFALETVERASSGGGTGGTGVSQGTARCLESTYTQRYLDEMNERVLARWRQDELGADVVPNAEVVLAFQLDASGSAKSIRVKRADSEGLGASCVSAMRDASPFPPLGGDLRCLAGKRLTATFRAR